MSPTRGAQGNALKTILAMGYVLDRERQGGNAEAVGVTIIETRGVEHRIEFRVDHVNNQPKIIHTTSPSPIKIGTRITINWPVIDYGGATLLDYARGEFIQARRGLCLVQPAPDSARCPGSARSSSTLRRPIPIGKNGGRAIRPAPHWYDETRLQRYLAAHVARDRDLRRNRTVREFIAEFRGLSGTAVQRKVLDEVGCSHQSLAAVLRRRAGQPRRHRQAAGVDAASTASRSPPKHLGVIGAEHLKQRFLAAGGNADTFKYQQRKGIDQRRHPIRRRVRFRAASIRLDAGRQHVPQVHHRRQLERRRSAIRSAPSDQPAKGWRARWPRCGPTPPAGDLRAASGVGVHPVRGPRQKLDHPRPTTRSSPMTNSRPRNIANDILDCRRNRDQQMDAAEEIRGAASRQ